MCAHVLCTIHSTGKHPFFFLYKKNWNKNPTCCYDLFGIENGRETHHGFPLARLKNYYIFNHMKMLLPFRKLNYNLFYCAAAPNIASSRGVICKLPAETLSFENGMHSAWTPPKMKSFQINWKHLITNKPKRKAEQLSWFKCNFW